MKDISFQRIIKVESESEIRLLISLLKTAETNCSKQITKNCLLFYNIMQMTLLLHYLTTRLVSKSLFFLNKFRFHFK